MAMPRLFTFVGGKIKSVILSIQASAGAADADKLIATGADGKLHPSFLPAGVGASTVVAIASEALSAGEFVDLYSDGGALRVRKADASTLKAADGFVMAGVANGASATVYPLGELNSQLTGLTPGLDYYLSTSAPGGVQTAAPSAAGQLYQRLGVAVSATELQSADDLAVEIA